MKLCRVVFHAGYNIYRIPFTLEKPKIIEHQEYPPYLKLKVQNIKEEGETKIKISQRLILRCYLEVTHRDNIVEVKPMTLSTFFKATPELCDPQGYIFDIISSLEENIREGNYEEATEDFKTILFNYILAKAYRVHIDFNNKLMHVQISKKEPEYIITTEAIELLPIHFDKLLNIFKEKSPGIADVYYDTIIRALQNNYIIYHYLNTEKTIFINAIVLLHLTIFNLEYIQAKEDLNTTITLTHLAKL